MRVGWLPAGSQVPACVMTYPWEMPRPTRIRARYLALHERWDCRVLRADLVKAKQDLDEAKAERADLIEAKQDLDETKAEHEAELAKRDETLWRVWQWFEDVVTLRRHVPEPRQILREIEKELGL
jgi:hypothetical protein